MESLPLRLVTRATIALAAVLLFAVYLAASFAASGDADVMGYSSGIYDMDVSRVVADLTTGRSAYRPSVHPLQKLFLAPVGGFLNRWLFEGYDRLGAARLMIALAMTLQTLAVGWLASQLSGGSRLAGWSAAAVSACSFSSLLAAAIPESAAFASLTGVLPLIYLNTRIGRPLGWGEVGVWSLLAVLCFALTITQIVFWVVAIGVRVVLLRGEARITQLVPRLLASVLLAALLVGAGARVQSSLYAGTPPFYSESPMQTEAAFLRTGEFVTAPLRHGSRLLRQVALDAFVAPVPGYSDFLVRDYGLDYWSLSSEEAPLRGWSIPRLALGAAALACVLFGLASLRRADDRFLAPVLCVASQLGIHLFYGREYLLYSPHWHGVFVALLVAAAWRRLGARRGWLPVAAFSLSFAMLVNGFTVLGQVYREVGAGLDVEIRARDGKLRPPATSRFSPTAPPLAVHPQSSCLRRSCAGSPSARAHG